MKDVYADANLKILEKRFPDIWRKIRDCPLPPRGKVSWPKKGAPNLTVSGSCGESIVLHHPSDPQAEVPQFLDLVPEDALGVVFLFGMGLGYTPLALCRQRPRMRALVIFEADIGVLKQALTLMDLSELLSDPRLILSVGETSDIEVLLEPVARALQLESVFTLKHLPCFQAFPEIYDKLYRDVFEVVNKLNVGGGTNISHGTRFAANRVRQLTAVHHHQLLESLQGAFRGKPAVLVAGGPSLDRNISLLPQVQDKAVIFACDTVLPSLHKEGVIPNFIASIDPKDSCFENLAAHASEYQGSSLLCMSWVTPKVPKYFMANHVFWAFSGNHMERWINQMVGGSLLAGGAGTVAQLNLAGAIIMGCSPIIFMGQDFAYTGFKDHASNIALNDMDRVKRLLNTEDSVIWVEDVHGDKVPSSRDFIMMKQVFERTIHEHPGIYIDASEGGAFIKGTEVAPLATVIEKYCSNEISIQGKIDGCVRLPMCTAGQVINGVDRVYKTVVKLLTVARKGDLLIPKILRQLSKLKNRGVSCFSFKDFPLNLQKRINQNDLLTKQMDREEMIWELLEEVTMIGLRESERMLHEISKIENIPGNYLESVLLKMERLKLINRVRSGVLDQFSSQLRAVMKHLKRENRLMDRIASRGRNNESLLALAGAYVASDDLVLARPLVDELMSRMPESAELLYYAGVLAVKCTEPGRAEDLFQRCVALDGHWEKKVKVFREKIGDEYLEYANARKAEDRRTYRKLIFKGMGLSPDHSKLTEIVRQLFEKDLTRMKISAGTAPFDHGASFIPLWFDGFETYGTLVSLLKKASLGRFYQYAGNYFVAVSDLEHARYCFKKSLIHDPANLDVYIFLTDVFFAQGKFQEGVESLQKAVSQNRTYGKYWEIIGNNLAQKGEVQDAVSAYEQALLAIPENSEPLKKMGECYLTMGNREAAQEALKHYKEK